MTGGFIKHPITLFSVNLLNSIKQEHECKMDMLKSRQEKNKIILWIQFITITVDTILQWKMHVH